MRTLMAGNIAWASETSDGMEEGSVSLLMIVVVVKSVLRTRDVMDTMM